MGDGHCYGSQTTQVNIILAVLDGLIAAVAYFQLLRLYMQNRHGRCTRQKVFHCLIGASNLGYLVYFVLTPIAKCSGWRCWSHACGFIVMAVPQVIFLATFLLLLSFWVDLCHQATDREDDEEDEDEQEYVVLPSVEQRSENYRLRHGERRRKCCSCWRCPHIRSRQKFVIAVVAIIFAFTVTFALLIWIGMGKNSLNSVTLAQVYSDIFAIAILFSGGGLAGYGLLLYHKMSRVRSGRPSNDLRKVAGLAVVSVVCFSLRAFLVLFTDIPVLDIWRSHTVHNSQNPVLVFLYYFTGESIPSVVVLWVLREIPSRSSKGTDRPRFVVADNGLLPDQTLIQQWMAIEEDEMSSETSSEMSHGKRVPVPKVRRDSPG
eukprot:c25921_g1_i2 orf=439-1563(-)